MAQEQYIYELIDIEWSLNYDFTEPPLRVVRDGEGEEDAKPEEDNPIEYDENGIPKGRSIEEIRMREKIISEYMHQWTIDNPERYVHNISLKDNIFIKGKSIGEMLQHSSKRYESTIGALQFAKILESAILHTDNIPVKKGNNKQAEFHHMMILTYQQDNLGLAKVTVGVKKSNNQKIQYGITVLEEGQDVLDTFQREAQPKKKKTSHRKR